LQRYRDYNSYLKEIFGERVQKIPLDAGFSCPNRDGTISYTGCIYCNSRGSGTGAMAINNRPIDEQMDEGKRFAQRRYKAKKFIAYFQAFTNTHAPVQKLKGLYDQALQHDGVVGLSIGTRPDCIDEQILELIT
jgi:radical SAM protein (TIGR01212 family)